MIHVKSFLRHFNLKEQFSGSRNSFNNKNRTILYRLNSVFLWIAWTPVKLIDLIGGFYAFNFLRNQFLKTRELSFFEINQARLVFGNSIEWKRIRIREQSFLARLGAKINKSKHIGFVLFETINFSRKLNHKENERDIDWLIHELVHVIQFYHLGSNYIPEAIRAQRNGGYGYGGRNTITKTSNTIAVFNLEQQAEIARHYYLEIKSECFKEKEYQKLIEDLIEGRI